MTALSPVELAVGFAVDAPPAPPLPAPGRTTPLAAIEGAMLPALLRAPCLVSFSGGRDSSAVLAIATRLARRCGLADPIPATIRVPAAADADEAAWQKQVVAHLRLADWARLEFTDELDVVGPVARAAMRRHGLPWPCNAHLHMPLLEAARGGSLITGIGGDELFAAASCPRATAVLAGRVKPVARDARRVVHYGAPRPLRRWYYRRADLPMPWLTPAGRRAVAAAFAALDASEPRRLGARLAWMRGSAALVRVPETLHRLAADAGAAIAHPLLDAAVWAAVGSAAPRGGYLGRDAAMRDVVGELLPRDVVTRTSKAGFDAVLFARHSRGFAATWSGEGVPDELVDASALRAHWAEPAPSANSFTLLQAAFLASRGEAVHEQRRRGRERVPVARPAEAQDGQ